MCIQPFRGLVSKLHMSRGVRIPIARQRGSLLSDCSLPTQINANSIRLALGISTGMDMTLPCKKNQVASQLGQLGISAPAATSQACRFGGASSASGTRQTRISELAVLSKIGSAL